MTTIIAFAGRKQSGKTTCSEFLKNVLSVLGTASIYNFADPLKQDICMNILGLTYDQCYGDDNTKNSLTSIKWSDVPGYEESWVNAPDYDPSGFMTARQIMQIVGTDIFRKMKHDVWAAATIKRITNDQLDFAIIADCRFPNEVDAVKAANGYVIKLTRDPYHSDHTSESALDYANYDHANFDLVIDNANLSILEQNNKILEFLKDKGMILL